MESKSQLFRKRIQREAARRFVAKRQGNQWGIFDGDKLVEGGFFDRDAAQDCADLWNLNP